MPAPGADLVIAARPHEVAIAGHGSRRDTAPGSAALRLFALKTDSLEYRVEYANFTQLVFALDRSLTVKQVPGKKRLNFTDIECLVPVQRPRVLVSQGLASAWVSPLPLSL